MGLKKQAEQLSAQYADTLKQGKVLSEALRVALLTAGLPTCGAIFDG